MAEINRPAEAIVETLAHRLEILVARLRLGEDPARLLFFFDMVFDVLPQHLDLGVVEVIARLHRFDFGDQLLGAIG